METIPNIQGGKLSTEKPKLQIVADLIGNSADTLKMPKKYIDTINELNYPLRNWEWQNAADLVANSDWRF